MPNVRGDNFVVGGNSRTRDPDGTFDRFPHTYVHQLNDNAYSKKKEYRLMPVTICLFQGPEALIPRHKSHNFNAETAWPSKRERKVAPGTGADPGFEKGWGHTKVERLKFET